MREFQIRVVPAQSCAVAILYLLILSSAALTISLYLTFSNSTKDSNVEANIVEPEVRSNHEDKASSEYSRRCQEMNLAVVCGGFNSTKSFYILLKSILFYRTDIIRLHLFVDTISHMILKELFKTWTVPDLQVVFYNLTEYEHDVAWITSSHYSRQYGLLKLAALDVMIKRRDVSKVLLMDSDMLVMGNLNKLWRKFSRLEEENLALGLVENQSDWYLNKGKLAEHRRVWPAAGRGYNTGIILADLEELLRRNWISLWRQVAEMELATHLSATLADQDILNALLKRYKSLVLNLPCNYNIQLNDHANLDGSCDLNDSELHIVHWNSPRKLTTRNAKADYYKNWYLSFKNWDAKLLEQSACSPNFSEQVPSEEDKTLSKLSACSELRPAPKDRLRTYLYFQDFELDNPDITMVVHLSIDRLQTLDELALHWQGPISAAIYLSELETQLLQSSIEMSNNLMGRRNIGYHLVFRDYGFNYPINRLRNIALDNALTPYVFMTDVDFLPSFNLYSYLNKIISEMLDSGQANSTSTKKRALIVPAFESLQYKFNFPLTKAELLTQLSVGSISVFREQIWPAGHLPTDYVRWRVSTKPYRVEWKPEYEPFIVTNKEVVRFDERFSGFGWNKVEQIMQLAALGYEFWVLPEAFVIHKIHAASFDIMQHRNSLKYRSCIKQLKRIFLRELSEKYPNFFESIIATTESRTDQ